MTDADQERVRPRKTMKKKGPHRSQSRKALPGSSRLGLGNTTSLRLLTILERSLLTVSQTGSVSVLGAGPNPEVDISGRVEGGGGGGGREEEGGFGIWDWDDEDLGGTGLGRLEEMKGEEEETGIEARGGLGGLAGRTVAGEA